MSALRPPVLTLGPPIAKPRKKNLNAHIAKPQPISSPRSSRSVLRSSSPHAGNIIPNGSFNLGHFLKDHTSNGKSNDDNYNSPLSNKKPHIRKIGMSSSEHRSFSIDLSDISKPADLACGRSNQGNRKIQHSASLRKTRHSMGNDSFKDSPLAFNEQAIENHQEDIQEEGQVVVITIHSNWGDPNFLRISSISILDNNYMAVQVLRSTTSPDLGVDTSCLFDGHLIKKEIDQLFSIPWNSNHEPVRIAIVVPADIEISGVRIFNSEISLDSSVKDITILLDSSNTLNGEIPKNFGIDFKFTQQMRQDAIESSRLIDDYFNENREKSFQDQYGFYPLFSTKTLSFEIKKSWTDEYYIGLNGIEIYDQYNKLIQLDDIDDIIIHHCRLSNSPSLLIKHDMHTSRPEKQFLTEIIPGKNPLIEIIFKENHFLSRIVLWNFNSSSDPVEYGVKYIKICSDENVIWCGKIQKSTGNEMSADKKIKTIWLTDSTEIKNQSINNRGSETNQLVA